MEVLVHRTRKTRVEWTLATDVVRLQATGVPRVTGLEPIRGAIAFEFEIASAGGGGSVIRLSVTPEAFAEVLEFMMIVDAKATREAYAYADSLEYEGPDPDGIGNGDYV